MSADKRTVSTDALETLGMIHTREEKRDAIHLAVLPVEAGEDLSAGDHVHVLDGKAFHATAYSNDAVGIVDPFIHKPNYSYGGVNKGERFWLVIYPRVITSLRHVWTHPAFADEPGVSASQEPSSEQKAASEEWLRKWIRNADCPDFDTVIKAATGQTIEDVEDYGTAYRIEDYGDGPSLFFSGRDAHSSIPPEFWDHIEIFTGIKVPADRRAVSFSCSC